MIRIPFTRETAHLAVGFECGTATIYQTEVADWIRNVDEQTWDEIDAGRLHVWLYLTDDKELIGFASLGLQMIEFDEKSPAPQEVLIVPYFGVQSRFHKKPDGPWQQYYSRQVFGDLLTEARKHPGQLSQLFLYVHPENAGAIRLYEQFGFTACGAFAGYTRMKRDLAVSDPPMAPGP